MESSARINFMREVTRLRRAARWAAAGAAVLGGIGALGLAALMAGVLDWQLALASGVRVTLQAGFAIIAAGAIVFAIWSAWGIRASHAAVRADRALHDERRRALAAHDLLAVSSDGAAATPLRGFLMTRAMSDAAGVLAPLSAWKVVPQREIRTAAIAAALPAVLIALIFLAAPDASRTIAARLIDPRADIPPVSPYEFHITPAQPSVIYGEDAVVTVRISGDEVSEPVVFATRRDGVVSEAASFQESAEVFAGRLESVVDELEIGFRTGRARSRWIPLEVIHEPRIGTVEAEVTPPAYAGQRQRKFVVGAEPLAVMEGARIDLVVQSNRPMAGGRAEIRAVEGEDDEIDVVTGSRAGTNSVAFSWTAGDDAEVAVSVRDIRGTWSRDPLVIMQNVIPDEPPEAALTDPPAFALATPASEIAVRGYAEDDLALKRVELVRAVVGYRDRVRPLAAASGDDKVTLDAVLDMSDLGVEPGQTLEFYLEASDSNPSLTGVGSSDIARVEIISEEDYAAMLRARTTVEEFEERYRALAETLQSAREALESAAAAANNEAASDAERGDAIEAAGRALESARNLFSRMANDFPAFDIERDLVDASARIRDALERAAEQINGLAPGSPNAAAALAQALEALGASQQDMNAAQQDAEEIASIARVMRHAAEFQRIYREQSELVRRLDRLADPSARSADASLLGYARTRQEEILARLRDLVRGLADDADGLPDGYAELRDSAIEFSRQIELRKIPETMENAAAAAGSGDGTRTRSLAALAREQLKSLLDDASSDSFGAMCQGGLRFSVPDSLSSTLSQMLDGLLGSGMGGTGAGGTGGGGTGSGESGFATGGSTPLNVPVIGPDRLSFGSPPRAGSGAGGKGRDAGSGTPDDASVAAGAIDPSRVTTERTSTAATVEPRVPERYLDAVRKYFSASPESP